MRKNLQCGKSSKIHASFENLLSEKWLNISSKNQFSNVNVISKIHMKTSCRQRAVFMTNHKNTQEQ